MKTALPEAGSAAGRSKQTVVGDRYRRLTARRGRKRAALAGGRMILELCSHLATTGQRYHEPTPDARAHRRRDLAQRRRVRQLERLGVKVTRQPLEAA